MDKVIVIGSTLLVMLGLGRHLDVREDSRTTDDTWDCYTVDGQNECVRPCDNDIPGCRIVTYPTTIREPN